MTARKYTLAELDQIFARCTPGRWMWWTSCSWRRLGTTDRDAVVICPTVHPYDQHPDCIVSEDDQRAIEAAHEALPRLVEAVKLAKAALKKYADVYDGGAGGARDALAKLEELAP